MDLERQILPRRDHPLAGAGNRPRGRHPGVRKGFLADRRLRRRRGVRHRHFRRDRAGARGGRTPARMPRTDGRAAAATLSRAGRARHRASRSGRDPPHRDVVGAAKPVHGDDAQLLQPLRHVRLRRALLRLLSQAHRRRPSDARRGDRGDGLRLAKRDGHAARRRRRTDRRSGTRSRCGTTWRGRSATTISTASPTPS